MLENSFEKIINSIKKLRIYNIKYKYSFNIFKSLNCCIWKIKLNRFRKDISHFPNSSVLCENVDFEKVWNKIKVDDEDIIIMRNNKSIDPNNIKNTFYDNVKKISRGDVDFSKLTLRKNRS